MTALDPSEIAEMDPSAEPPAVPSGPDRFINRELSWLHFNERVLALAENTERPLLERAKFLAIFASNLDEFFQVRVAGLERQAEDSVPHTSADGLTAEEQLQAIHDAVVKLAARHARVFTEVIAPELRQHDIALLNWDELDEDDRRYLNERFEESIFPVLTPLSVDPSHPFPYISDKSLNLGVVVSDPHSGVQRFARVKVPPNLDRFWPLPEGQRFVPVEQIIAAHFQRLFTGNIIENHAPFRVTRDADWEVSDEAEDLLAAVRDLVRSRHRFGEVVRIERGGDMSEYALEFLLRELHLDVTNTYDVPGPLDLTGLWALHRLARPELKDRHWVPLPPPDLTGGGDTPLDFFDVLRRHDVLVHHPYDSYERSVEEFVQQAAADPNVLAIKNTIYRTDDNSASVDALIAAAEAGKQVVALVELTARFDEKNNAQWAEKLEQAQVHVVYGIAGLKTHAKVLLVVRQEGSRIRRYCHVGTGNYNAKTAGTYEDIGLFTADAAIGRDLTELFNHLTGYSEQTPLDELIIAPTHMRGELIARINEQARPGGRIIMKMNSLVDPASIDALYAASRAGAEIDLIIRGICCLRADVPGLSENIRVRSIIGRFLEHSRVYRFGDGEDTEYLMGSADLMPRNLDKRVEALVPVKSPALRDRLDEILETCLADNVLAWTLHDAEWTRVTPPTGGGHAVDTHELLMERALTRSGRVEA